MTDEDPERFRSRRVEVLSDTVFGVAMTFMAYRLPVPRLGDPAPSWAGMGGLFGSHLPSLTLSLWVAASFWISHHRRLAMHQALSVWETVLNLGFLAIAILLPVTTDLFGTFGTQGDTVAIYAAHLLLLGSLDLLLWVLAVRRTRKDERDWSRISSAVAGCLVFVGVLGLAQWRPEVARPLLFVAFLAPVARRLTALRGA
jgi:uncharacterized membrane protein